MKRVNGILLFLLLTIAGYSCKHSASQDVRYDKESVAASGESQPEIKFLSNEHDFGKVTEGEKVGWYFKFRNTGGSDLIITNATASCGCTVPEYDRQPVPPGGEGTVKIVFDSSDRLGKQLKTVTIETNGRTLISRLILKADVSEK